MIDKNSETWQDIQTHLDKELAAASRKLESPSTSHDMTMFHRGVHAALQAVKALSENKEPVAVLLSSEYS